MNIYGLVFSLILVAVGGILYLAGKFLRPNPFIGFRIGPTFADKRVRERINCEAGAAFLGFGTVTALLALLNVYTEVIIASSIVGILLITGAFIWRAYRLAEYYTTMSPAEVITSLAERQNPYDYMLSMGKNERIYLSIARDVERVKRTHGEIVPVREVSRIAGKLAPRAYTSAKQ